MLEVVRVWGDVPPLEKNADQTDFTPERAYLLMEGVYGDFPYHNDGSYLYREVADDTLWQRRWRWIAAQSASWYAIPQPILP